MLYVVTHCRDFSNLTRQLTLYIIASREFFTAKDLFLFLHNCFCKKVVVSYLQQWIVHDYELFNVNERSVKWKPPTGNNSIRIRLRVQKQNVVNM